MKKNADELRLEILTLISQNPSILQVNIIELLGLNSQLKSDKEKNSFSRRASNNFNWLDSNNFINRDKAIERKTGKGHTYSCVITQEGRNYLNNSQRSKPANENPEFRNNYTENSNQENNLALADLLRVIFDFLIGETENDIDSPEVKLQEIEKEYQKKAWQAIGNAIAGKSC